MFTNLQQLLILFAKKSMFKLSEKKEKLPNLAVREHFHNMSELLKGDALFLT